MLKKLAIMLIIMLFSVSYSKAEEDDSQYKDWNSVLNLLAAKGIPSREIVWSELSSKCVANKPGESPILFNKCMYIKGLDKKQYARDVSYCNSVAEQKYFEFIKPSLARNITVNNLNSVKKEPDNVPNIKNDNLKGPSPHNIPGTPGYRSDIASGQRENVAVLSEKQIADFKKSALAVCMHDSGWNDPNSWEAGRREHSY